MFPRALERARSAVARISLVSVRSLTLPEIGFRGLERAEESGLWPVVFEIRFAKSPAEAYFAMLWSSGCCNDIEPQRLSFSKVSNNRRAIRAVALVREGLARYRIHFAEALVKQGSLLIFPIIRKVGNPLQTNCERSGARIISEAPDARKLYHVRFVFNEELLGVRAVIVELKCPIRAVPLTRVSNTAFSRTLAIAAGCHLYRFRVLFEKPMRKMSEFPPINVAWNPDDSYTWGIVTEWLVLELKRDTDITAEERVLVTNQETNVQHAQFLSNSFRKREICRHNFCKTSKKSTSGIQIYLPEKGVECERVDEEDGVLCANREHNDLQSSSVPETSCSDRSVDQISSEGGADDRDTRIKVWTLPPRSRTRSQTSTSSCSESDSRGFQSIDIPVRKTSWREGEKEFVQRNDSADPISRAGLLRENEVPDRFWLFPSSLADVANGTTHKISSADRNNSSSSTSNCTSFVPGMGEELRRECASGREKDATTYGGQIDHCAQAQSKTFSTKNDEIAYISSSDSCETENTTNNCIESGSPSMSFSESDVSSDEGRTKRYAKSLLPKQNNSASRGEISGSSPSSSRSSFGRYLRRRPRRTPWPFAKVGTNEPPSPSRSRSFPSLRPPLSPMTPIIGSEEPSEKCDMVVPPVFMPPLRFGAHPRHQENVPPQQANFEVERKGLSSGALSRHRSVRCSEDTTQEACQECHYRCPTCGNAQSQGQGGDTQSSSIQDAERNGCSPRGPIPPAGVPSTSTSAGFLRTGDIENGQSKCSQQASRKEDSPGVVSRNSVAMNSATSRMCSERRSPSEFTRVCDETRARSDHSGWRNEVKKILRENGRVIIEATLTALGMTLLDLLTVRSTASENSDGSNIHDEI